MALEITVRKIVSWYDESKVLWEGEATSDREMVEKAVVSVANLQDANLQYAKLQGANLQGANLQYANLQGANLQYANLQGANLQDAKLQYANLQGAKHLRLPTGETWAEYLTVTVPALLTAGGKSLDSFAEHFQCHDWNNCPMAHAFDVHRLEEIPILLRPRAQQFIDLFDAKQIPWPLPTADQLAAK